MRKASHILLKIGGILSFVAAGALFVASLVYLTLVILLSCGVLNDAIENGSIHVDASSLEVAIAILTVTYIVGMIVFLFFVVFNLISGTLAFKADSKKTKKGYILSIVFAVLGENYVTLAGSILGVIVAHKAENKAKKEEAEVIDVKEAK